MKWIAGNERLPGMFKEVKWRNHDGGDIPLGKRSPIDHYQKVGPNAGWHQWLDESESLPTPCSKTMEEALNNSMFMNGGNTDEEKRFYAMGFKAALHLHQNSKQLKTKYYGTNRKIKKGK